jgi:hypothetical protein
VTQDALRKAGEAPDIRKGVRPVVERLYERCADWMDKAERAGDETGWPLFIAAVREARQSAELVARLNGELAREGAGGPAVAIQIVCPAGQWPSVCADDGAVTIDIGGR